MGGLIATPHPTAAMAAIVASSIASIPSAAAAAAAMAPAASEASLPRSAAAVTAGGSVFPNVLVAGSLSFGYRLRPGDPGDLIFITS